MSNGYFTLDNPQARRTLARAESVNATDRAIEAAFDKLPAEAVLKQGRVTYGTDSGAANAYVVTLPYAPAAYTEGMEVVFKPGVTNTGASTVNIVGVSGLLGVKSIKRIDGTAPIAFDIIGGGFVVLRYDGTDFRLVAAQAGDVILAKDWAQKTGATVDGAGYSAKEHASGAVVPTGSAKDWASSTAGLVGGSGYSAKEFAIGSQAGTGGSAKNWAQESGGVTGAAAGSFSAKDWAFKVGATVDGTYYSARQYALNAAQSASDLTAAVSAAAGSAGAAAGSATAAAASAAGVNLPAVTIADAGKALRVKSDGSGFAAGLVATYWGGAAGGSANALTATTGASLTSLTVGAIVGVKIATANTGAATLALDSVAATAIRKDGVALVGGELAATTDRHFQYDGTFFRLLGGGVDAASIFASIKPMVVAGPGVSISTNDTTKTITISSASVPYANLLAWYDASYTASLYQASGSSTPVTATGQTVGTWQDRSGNGAHLESANTGERPTYRAADGPNSTPCVRFDGGDDRLSRALALPQPLHVIIILRFATAPSTTNANILGEPSVSSGWTIRTGQTPGQLGLHEAGVAYRISSSVSPGTTWRKFQAYSGGGTGFVVLDSTTTSGSYPTTTAGITTLAMSGGATLLGVTLDVAEVLIYGAQQTGSALAGINAYFAAKYGI